MKLKNNLFKKLTRNRRIRQTVAQGSLILFLYVWNSLLAVGRFLMILVYWVVLSEVPAIEANIILMI